METRKVQVTGKSTYIVTLPKKWAVDSGLVAGALVRISYLDDGSIVITPPEHGQDPRMKRLKFDNASIDGRTVKSAEETMRDLIGAYVMGYQAIEVYADHNHIPKELARAMKRTCHNLIGFEVIEETDEKVVIQDLLDAGEFTIERGVKRMSSLVSLMLDGLINYLKTGDTEILSEIISRDDEVDRAYLLISKQFVNRLSLIRSMEVDKLSLIESFYYRLAAGNLERIADHAVKIAEVFSHIGIPATAPPIKESVSVPQNLVISSIESLRKSNVSLANEVISENTLVKKRLSKSVSTATPVTAISSPEIIFDSLIRIGDYAANIAELAIDLSQL
ncbi:MAG: phosphate uptake regulator PhoU [Methanosarcinales archaeon]|nr:MAG: phosphate uptake regulator PhoU [Methanosarcinales archaeon]